MYVLVLRDDCEGNDIIKFVGIFSTPEKAKNAIQEHCKEHEDTRYEEGELGCFKYWPYSDSSADYLYYELIVPEIDKLEN